MRYSKVTADGTYVPPPAANAKASYATMVYVRATIVEDAGWYLAKAATIAVRPFQIHAHLQCLHSECCCPWSRTKPHDPRDGCNCLAGF